MTSHELRKWINDQILSGKMTVAESSPYIGLTLNGMPLTGVGSPDDAWQNQPHDYLADLQAGISGARWRGNEQELRLLESVWARLTREQEATTRG
ncbi:MAG TPA: hypothetical protein PLN52_03470 [Opitutaceae bacterium]|nr:hypothetical protein [Opitutaceae bacterium]